MEYVLKTKDLKKTYGNYNALNGLLMNVPKGSIYGLIGRNGVGKTTLIRLICGLQKATEGDFSLYGINNHSMPTQTAYAVYGNMFYVELVNQYLTVAHFDNATAQAIMNEALKYQGWKYVYGGSNPNTSFDCSGLVQWCYGKAGISLPRTAQAQYDATQHLPLSQAKAGDLVFFHSTYNAGSYVTHVGIYVGNNQMYHAGDPIGYADLSSSYWQQHLIGAGRVKQ